MPRSGFKVNRTVAKLKQVGVVKGRRWQLKLTRRQARLAARRYRSRHPDYVQRGRDASLLRYWTVTRGTERQREIWRKAQAKKRKFLRDRRERHTKVFLNLRIQFLVCWIARQRRMAKKLGHSDILIPEAEAA